MTKPKKVNRNGLIQTRVDNSELQEILTKSHLYARGNLSEFVRMACLNYKPVNKSQKVKL